MRVACHLQCSVCVCVYNFGLRDILSGLKAASAHLLSIFVSTILWSGFFMALQHPAGQGMEIQVKKRPSF